MAASKNPWVETPLIESTTLSKAAGCRIFLKLDNLQLSGSFKARGIGHLMQTSLSNSSHPTSVHFYSSSGGNAGLAAVHSAVKLGRPCTVVVPLTTKPMMMAKMQAAGASEVLQHGASWQEADDYLRGTVIKTAEAGGEECVYVPPFDHPTIWTGHSSLIDEISAQLPSITGEKDAKPEVLACSVGGGGLFNGIMEGVERHSWTETQILAVETQGADSLAESVRVGEHITLPAITSQATTLGAKKVAARTFELAMSSKQVKTLVLSDEEAMMGAWRLAEDERLLVELSCSVTVALCYGDRLEKALGREVSRDDKVVIIVCGGSNVTIDMVSQWKKDSAHIDAEPSQEEKATVSSANLM
ncbi:tryptophan synthase beta subunit-like PLP-dependent enzyme [Aureobasidium pullulans]|uniref:L-serine ammonia-lyase n=1 Tax=Aureobasidium pullulans TaxID=5580 RepID=A0A4S9KW70_AURPU|nr:tryptophan synthase beta subunit-like PLP-dependent enzyme [Aureobasidium pullulans]